MKPKRLARAASLLGVLACVTAYGCSDDQNEASGAGARGGMASAGVAGRSGAAGKAGSSSDTGGTLGEQGGEAGQPGLSNKGGEGALPLGAGGNAGAAGSGGEGGSVEPQPTALTGNIDAEDLPDHGSVGFVLIGDKYAMFKKEGAEDTSISFVSSDGKRGYGWYRDKPISDPTNVDTAFSLDLATGEFTDIPFDDSRASIVRGGYGHKLVGKMILMKGTPDTTADDVRAGFVYDLEAEDLEIVERDGHSDTGFTAMNAAGTITGFNDFGELGFIYENGKFQDLTAPSAYRLFPFAITTQRTIVGAWGETVDDWYEETKGAGFVASPDGRGGFTTKKYTVDGYSAVYLTGINDSGQFCGTGFQTETSYRELLRGSDLDETATAVPFAEDYEPFPTGITESGWIFGQSWAVEVKKDCAGHGSLVVDSCDCDLGYESDPYDAKNCIALGAPCNGHGHEHEAGICHCEADFKNPIGDKSQCVPS